MEVNKSTLAKIFGVSTNTVGKWMGEGCPHERDGREVEFETVAVMEWMYGEQPTLNVVKSRITADYGEGDESERLDPEQEKARADKERADKLALDNQIRRGELVWAVDVEQEWAKVLMTVRAGFLALPSMVSEEIAVLVDARQVKGRLSEEVNEILEELANADGEEDSE